MTGISFHSLFVVSNADHSNYMTGSIVKLKKVVKVETENRDSSSQQLEQITKLYHKANLSSSNLC